MDFDDEEAGLLALADALDTHVADGTTTVTPWGEVRLAGASPTVNVFRVDAADLAGARAVRVEAPAGDVVYVLVSGDAVAVTNAGLSLGGGITPERVLWVAPDATSVRLASIGWLGSLLAPRADVRFDQGELYGSIWAGSLVGTGELHLACFEAGVLCPRAP